MNKLKYITLNSGKLVDTLVRLVNEPNINLIHIPNVLNIPDLKDKISPNNIRCEVYKIINNNYGIRWVCWTGLKYYFISMWNANESEIKVTQILIQ